MSTKVAIVVLLAVVVLLGFPLAFQAKQGSTGRPAPDYGTPVEISPEQQMRIDRLKSDGANASITVLPVRVGAMEKTEDAETASGLARMINDARLCKAAPAPQSAMLRPSPPDPNEMNNLLFMANEFGKYVKKNPPETEYVLYADYIFTPNWEFVMVHFVICDRQGEWVVRDLQNSHHPDFQSINPKSKEDCSRLVLKRLQLYMR